LYVSDKSNVVLDFHGSFQDPDLVIFMAGNQYPVLPDLVAAFRGWIAAQPQHTGVKVDRIFYTTTPPGRLIDAMQAGQLRDDVRVALSSPVREPASYESYSATFRAQGGQQFPDLVLKKATTISPVAVHHRENPQFIYDGIADVAPMYYHFGRVSEIRI
jgi:hypothetical protein